MVSKFLTPLAFAGALTLASTSNATEVEGTFTATIADATGYDPVNSFALSSLDGSTITGTFAYNSQSLTLGSGSTIESTWETNGLGKAGVISATAGGQALAVTGSGQTTLTIYADESGNSDPANVFNFSTLASTGTGYSVFDLVVANDTVGSPYIGNLSDPGTVSFSHQSLAYGGQASSLVFYSGGNEVGEIEFGIADASASPVPLPASAWMLLGGIGLLGVAGRRRARACATG